MDSDIEFGQLKRKETKGEESVPEEDLKDGIGRGCVVCCFCWAGICWASLGDLDYSVATVGRGKKGVGDAEMQMKRKTARPRESDIAVLWHSALHCAQHIQCTPSASCDLL
ncbi:hypothetical protein NDU88_007128 [Pleurodeles waltl]|uniref:Uncharacterized protein n=1 Tax=Pleurodeles waltl TaxID=8319 RepID=A0AAV7U1E2_PLEWA|nr:hypothetical protein NDU88_007128 [Pleurodeles waltl]